MTKIVKIAPSILSADFGQLKQELEDIEKSGADLVHVDVMDGHFVPNLTIGPPVVKAIRRYSTLPFDVHLMMSHPFDFIEAFAMAGADALTIHIETENVSETLEKIKSHKKQAGLSLRPKTPIESLEPYLPLLDLVLVMTVEPGFGGQKFMDNQVEKIAWLHNQRAEKSLSFKIAVDGGVSPENAPKLWAAGADILIAGTSVFKDGPQHYTRHIKSLRG